MNRRNFVRLAVGAPLIKTSRALQRKRVVILMFDGFGQSYFDASPMPVLKRWASQGLVAQVQSQMPAVTNTNNASICCGVPASIHGITGNSYLNLETKQEDFMEDGRLLLAPTLFQIAAKRGLKSGLFTSKKKTSTLLSSGCSAVVAAESPTSALVSRYGAAPDIYSSEINYWLWDVVIDHLESHRDLDILYVHTTDYPMHMHDERSPESQAHLARIDEKLGEAAHLAPDTAFYISADHGMNKKTRAWDLAKACANRETPVRIAISAERDKYPKHHRGLGGIAYVYLRAAQDAGSVARTIEKLPGVEQVMNRSEAAEQYLLRGDRIGDLVVTGNRETVFGDLDTETEVLDTAYRSHGSRYELQVPLVIHDESRKLVKSSYRRNFDLTAGLLDSLTT